MPAWEQNIGALRAAVRAGTVVSLLLAAGSALYFLLTLDRPHRLELVLVDAGVAGVAGTVWLLPLASMARRGLIAPFLVGWSTAVIALAAAAAAVDDNPASPLVATFFLPLIFAAMAYPLRLVVVVAAIDLAAMVLTLVLALERDAADVLLYTVVLVSAALLCSWRRARATATSPRSRACRAPTT